MWGARNAFYMSSRLTDNLLCRRGFEPQIGIQIRLQLVLEAPRRHLQRLLRDGLLRRVHDPPLLGGSYKPLQGVPDSALVPEGAGVRAAGGLYVGVCVYEACGFVCGVGELLGRYGA